MQTVKLKVYAYASNICQLLDVPAHVIGDIAIHRPASYDGSHKARLSDKGWHVSHVPTGASVNNARTRNLRFPGNLKDLKRWAARWQELAPDAFATLRERGRDAMTSDPELGRRLIDAAREADHTMNPGD